jgi:hypothetical protein
MLTAGTRQLLCTAAKLPCIFSTSCPMLKLDAHWRGGCRLNVARELADDCRPRHGHAGSV